MILVMIMMVMMITLVIVLMMMTMTMIANDEEEDEKGDTTLNPGRPITSVQWKFYEGLKVPPPDLTWPEMSFIDFTRSIGVLGAKTSR